MVLSRYERTAISGTRPYPSPKYINPSFLPTLTRDAATGGLCLNRSSDLPLDHQFPPAICTKPLGHPGMHGDGTCAWEGRKGK